MTAAEMVKVTVANNEARRQQAMIDFAFSPAVKEAMANYVKTSTPAFKISEQMKAQLAEIVAVQVKGEIPKFEIPSALLEQVQRQFRMQNETIAKVIKLHGPLPATAFKLPEGWKENVAIWREQLEAEGALGDPAVVESPAERLRRLADERQRIVDCLGQCSGILEACRLMGIPVPTPILALFVVAYVLGWAANGFFDDRDDLD